MECRRGLKKNMKQRNLVGKSSFSPCHCLDRACFSSREVNPTREHVVQTLARALSAVPRFPVTGRPVSTNVRLSDIYSLATALGIGIVLMSGL